ncbi:hypothetical protein [Desulfovibrio cuneatus]|uniref:hypothetical protein n=1 Tax=Desulfovibrio cuneatus TaxID=159728 RepID=UPI000488D12D|nr:hypothetical protein [Desulfovibrio cuneatus]
MSFDDFFNSNDYAKYQKYRNSRAIEQVFEFLESPEAVDKMIIATEHGRPALEGVIDEVENKAGQNFDITNDMFLRQAVGSYVKFVLEPFGYDVHRQKPLNKGKIITSATSYTFVEGKQKKRLVRVLAIEDIL